MTLLLGMLYVVIQQSLRTGAREPQYSMAKDTAYSIEHGGKPPMWDRLAAIDIATNMAPFTIMYDTVGNVMAGNGYLNGEIPTVPLGVLSHAGKNGKNVITWSPAKGVRIATVVIPAGDYYVLSGRSLLVVERQISVVGQWLLGIWAVALVALSIVYRATNTGRIRRAA